MSTYSYRNLDRGAVKVCPICKTSFWIPEPEMYAYKMSIKVGTHDQLLYFNKYSCKREYERLHAEELRDKRLKKIEQVIENRVGRMKRPIRADDYQDKHCETCRYFQKGKYGFADCTVYSFAISKNLAACNKYKPKEYE